MNAKQVLKETVFGNPTRFSNNYEACYLAFATPFLFHSPSPQYGEENVVDAWGVTNSFPLGTPGPFPVHTPDKVVIKDFGEWDKYVKFPSLDFPQQMGYADQSIRRDADRPGILRSFCCTWNLRENASSWQNG
jgi:hypothetical protein